MSANLLRHVPSVDNLFEFFDCYKVSVTTYQTYQSGLRNFSKWLDAHHQPDELPIPVSTLRDWLEDQTMTGLSHSTIMNRRWAVWWLHNINGYQNGKNPVYADDLRTISKQVKRVRASQGLCNKPVQKQPIRVTELKKLVRLCADDLEGKRDKCMLYLGFCGALRRSELAQLKVEDIRIQSDQNRAIITVTRAKTDQGATGRSLLIEKGTRRHCPIQALKSWLEAAGIKSGPVFRRVYKSVVTDLGISGKTVATRIKYYCKKAGLQESQFAGHSLRRGMMISAIDKKQSLHDIKTHARHHNVAMTEHYIGDAALQSSPTRGIFS